MSDPIKHVVVLMLENHSLDQMLGTLREVHPQLDGVDPDNLRQNTDADGRVYRQGPTTDRNVQLDPPHELENALSQIEGGNGGFIKDYAKVHPQSTVEQRAVVMGFYPRGFLFASHALGEAFTICDKWFSSVPGPTWTNRFFALTGTSVGRVHMPTSMFKPDLGVYNQTTLFDRLTEKGIEWRIFFHDLPQSLVLVNQRDFKNLTKYRPMARFYDKAAGSEAEFPAFSFIEPQYFLWGQNDDHPPHDVMNAAKAHWPCLQRPSQ